jgi:hypothetical protein
MSEISKQSLMQQALGEQWHELPEGLKAHYNHDEKGSNQAQGVLTVDYPWFMQWPLSFLRLLGALLNRRGVDLKTTVSKTMEDGQQYWHREITYPDGKKMAFKSLFTMNKDKVFIEYTNRFLGMKMKAFVEGQQLRYESCGYVLKLAKLMIPIPEWLALGHGSIVETAVNDDEFEMDFRLRHWLFGEVFSYKGRFRTLINNNEIKDEFKKV